METIEPKADRYRISNVGLAKSAAPRMRKCVFCAEMIQAEAIKCRYCGEFLNTDKARAMQSSSQQNDQSEDTEDDSGILFAGRPSFLGLIGTTIKGMFFLAVAVIMIKYPLEEQIAPLVEKLFGYQLSDGQYFAIGQYRVIAGIGLAVLVVLVLSLKVLRLKMIYYEVTPDRIEYSRGILDRRVDNLDMFRVVDLRLRRSLLDCVFGIGTVHLITNDKTDPEFTFEKIRDCRRLYDVIKRASLEADQKQGVIHLE